MRNGFIIKCGEEYFVSAISKNKMVTTTERSRAWFAESFETAEDVAGYLTETEGKTFTVETYRTVGS